MPRDEIQPDKLQVARIAKGHTQGSLADCIKVKQAYVSQIEHGQRCPSDEVVERWAEATDTPVDFFLMKEKLIGEGATEILHRKRATLPIKPLTQAHGISNQVRLHLFNLLEEVELESPLPRLRQASGGPEQAASELRRLWRIPLGPLPDLTAYVEASGVPVIVLDLGHRKLRALTVPLIGHGWVVLLNSKLSGAENRFSLAHELGHIVLDHHRSADFLDHEWPSDMGATATRDIEGEADRFAGELLMPESVIRSELRGLQIGQLGTLKRRWRVPMAALIYTAGKLRCIGPGQKRTFYSRLSQLRDSPDSEPGDFEMEQPQMVRTLVRALGDDGWSRSEVAACMRCSEPMLAERYLGERKRLTAVPSDSEPRRVRAVMPRP